jgi:hypothetical protein
MKELKEDYLPVVKWSQRITNLRRLFATGSGEWYLEESLLDNSTETVTFIGEFVDPHIFKIQRKISRVRVINYILTLF